MVIQIHKQQFDDELFHEANKIHDEVIQLQIAINGLRHKFDIPDESQMTESNQGFVQ